jgi:uncharacterized protein
MKVKCPTCGKPADYIPENKYRPFCSERCKLIDLGEWASGSYAIPVQTPPEPEELEAALEEAAARAGESPDDPDHLH